LEKGGGNPSFKKWADLSTNPRKNNIEKKKTYSGLKRRSGLRRGGNKKLGGPLGKTAYMGSLELRPVKIKSKEPKKLSI